MSQLTPQTSCPSCKCAIPLGKFCNECGAKLPDIVLTQLKGTDGELSPPVQVSAADPPSIGSVSGDIAREEDTSISSQSVTSPRSAIVDKGVVSISSQSNVCTTTLTAGPTVYSVGLVVSTSQSGHQADVKLEPSTNPPVTVPTESSSPGSSHPSSLPITGNEGNYAGSSDRSNKSLIQEKVSSCILPGGL